MTTIVSLQDDGAGEAQRSTPIVGPALVDIGRVAGREVGILEAVARGIIDPVRTFVEIQESAIEAERTPGCAFWESEPHGDLRRRQGGQSQQQGYDENAGQHGAILQRIIDR